jgi:hypothetical protein
MPDPVTHIVAAPVAGGLISTFIALMWGIEPNALIAAFVGTWIGVALLESSSFKKSIVLVTIGTVAAAYLIPIAFTVWPEYSKLSVAAIVGFVVVYFHQLVLDLIKDAVKRLFGKVGI